MSVSGCYRLCNNWILRVQELGGEGRDLAVAFTAGAAHTEGTDDLAIAQQRHSAGREDDATAVEAVDAYLHGVVAGPRREVLALVAPQRRADCLAVGHVRVIG